MKMLLSALAAVCIVSCAGSHSAPAASARMAQCFQIRVSVTAENAYGSLVAPGTGVDVIVRSTSGRVLRAGVTDEEGKAAFEVCWRADDPPSQVEARLNAGERFIGTLASFYNYSDTYCLTLPSGFSEHCGEWGTGPALPRAGKP